MVELPQPLLEHIAMPNNIKLEKVLIFIAIERAYTEIEMLADEIRDTLDNGTDAQLATKRFQALEDTCSTLEENRDAPDFPRFLSNLEVMYPIQPCKTRADRRSFAAQVIECVLESVRAWEEQNPEIENETVQQFMSDLEDNKDNWEGVDFPGFGRGA